MQTLRVSLGSRSYPIKIGSGTICNLASSITELENISSILLVTDGNVKLYHNTGIENALKGIDIPVTHFTIPPGESSKSAAMTIQLWEGFLNAGADRNSLVLVIGGGMVGDLGGFAAATYMRGIRVFQVPTTLLAQVDSSVGGKTAIDLDDGKNSVGAFHQPSAVLIDIDMLNTLPDREFRSGLGEVVKYGLGLDKDLWVYLEENAGRIESHAPEALTEIVTRCCSIKAEVVKADERETSGMRALLNLGHTFAHAYETADGFTNILHGEAVAVGLLDSIQLAVRSAEAGIDGFEGVTQDLFERVSQLCTRLSLPVRIHPKLMKDRKLWAPEAILDSMRKDKKSSRGKVRFVLPVSLGKSTVRADIPEQIVLETLRERLSE